MNLNPAKPGVPRGFTLVELLVAVAVIGVLTAIGISSMTGLTESAEVSKNRRNAQFAATIYSSARAAGATFASPVSDKEGLVHELIEGKNGRGHLRDTVFQLSGVSFTEASSLARYLEFSGSVGLLYNADGN